MSGRQDTVEAIRAELASERRAGAGPGRGFSAPLRRRVVEHAASAMQAGRPMTEIAMRLGISMTSLSQWTRQSAAPQAFREVVVAEAPPIAADDLYSVRHTKSGLVVDGVSLGALARLIRALS